MKFLNVCLKHYVILELIIIFIKDYHVDEQWDQTLTPSSDSAVLQRGCSCGHSFTLRRLKWGRETRLLAPCQMPSALTWTWGKYLPGGLLFSARTRPHAVWMDLLHTAPVSLHRVQRLVCAWPVFACWRAWSPAAAAVCGFAKPNVWL